MGSPPAIVMGISGKPEELVNLAQLDQRPIPLIKRYSGGGTVVVNEKTFFVSFIMEKSLHSFSLFPEPILRWSETFYQKALEIPHFSLKENDYVIENRKCGGNAEYIQKNRFVHHTSFLWDYDPFQMNYLLHPKKEPAYREKRSHEGFLCCLKDYLREKEEFFERVMSCIHQLYDAQDVNPTTLYPLLSLAHRKSTQMLDHRRFQNSVA